jgi:hypothetical protein
MPATIVRREAMNLVETKAVSFSRPRESTSDHSASLQNPTEWRRDSPFFGSVGRRFVLDGVVIGGHGSAMEDQNIDIVDSSESHGFNRAEAVTKKRARMLW